MELPGAPEVYVESIGDEATYQLPVRPLGPLRLAGLVPLGFSVVWFGFLSKILVPQFRHLANHPQPFDYFICAFLLCFVAAGCAPAALGLAALFGRCRIRWRNGHLHVSEQVGPFGWPRRMSRRPIRKFLVIGGGGSGPGGPLIPGPLGTLALLSAKFENGVSKTVAAGYPRPWLEAIAHDLSIRAGHAQGTAAPPVVDYQGPGGAPAGGMVEKPPGSPVTIQRGSASTTLEVPPTGLWKGSMGLFFFALFWCGITGTITVAFLAGKNFQLAMIPFFAIFWLIGLGVLAAAINMGRRRVTLTAGRSELAVVTSGPFGTKRVNILRANIVNITVGASRVEANHRPVLELQVRQATGEKTGFLLGRDPDELRWIAWELNQALGVTATDPAPPAATLAGFMGRPYAGAGPQPAGSLPGKILSLAIFAGLGLLFFWHFFAGFVPGVHRHSTPPAAMATNRYPSNLPVPSDPTLVFNAFGPGGTFRPTTLWGVGRDAHAEWFVPTLSGNLSEIVAAIDPIGGNPRPGKATIFLAEDRNGFPGRTLESFSVRPDAATNLLTLKSVKQPMLESGVKYWLGARSKGNWRWHFNDQNVVHNSARETGRNKWASAGDYCYIGAFSVRISTNAPPQTAATAGTNADAPENE